MDVLMYRV